MSDLIDPEWLNAAGNGRYGMSPIASFTASLGHDGNIDIFALALSPQAQPGHGAAVFRIRQKKAGGDWRP